MRRLSYRTSSGNGNGPTNGDDEGVRSRFGSRTASMNTRKVNQSIVDLRESMNYIKYEWPQILKEDANPIEMAILLLDDSSVGLSHKMPEFERISEDTTNKLRQVVNEHYEVFNTSVGSYHYLLSTSKNNQADAEDIKEMLESTSKEIHNKSDILQELNQTSSRYNEMIEILDAMEFINQIPSKIDQLTADKKIHEIYDVISQGYQVGEKYNLWSLSAMTSNKNYLDTQSNALFDIIFEELQNEIYIKNSAINSMELSWESLINLNNPKLSTFRNFLTRLNNFEQFIYNAANLDLDEISNVLNEDFKEFVEYQLPKLSTSSGDLSVTIELSNNYQRYYYIYQLLTTLFKLNRLNQGIDLLNQTNQQEIHNLIFRSIEEIKLKNLFEINKLNKMINFELNEFNEYSVKILKNLFLTIFIKCLIILKNQKIINEILMTFGIQLDFKSNWDTIKNELTTLMINYISTDENKTANEKNDELFKFDNLNLEKLNFSSNLPDFTVDNDDLYIKNESFQSNFEILVPINITNMRIIMEFFLIFTSSTNYLVNLNSHPINKVPINFFESFMKQSFVPKLKNYLILKFNDFIFEYNTDNINGFNIETTNVDNDKIFKNSLEFKSFFVNLCQLLNTSLTYRSDLNDLVLSFIEFFMDKYQKLYNDLIGNSNSKLNLWFKIPALNDLSKKIVTDDYESIDDMIEKEIQIMLSNGEIFNIDKDDLLDEENFTQLIHLLLTINWILNWLPNFKKEINYNYQDNLSNIEKLKYDWNFLENGKIVNFNSQPDPSKGDLNIYLSLDTTKMNQFNEYLRKFQQIKLNSIILIRYNLRLNSIYYISRSFKFSDWVLFNEPGNSDEFISKFNKEIFAFDNKISQYFDNSELHHILVGFHQFLNKALLKGSKLIRKINNNGVKKILINIFTLQQMLKNLSKDNEAISFQYSSYYFNCFTINENLLVQSLKDYPLDERENFARLLYSEKLADGNGSSFNTSKYNDLLNKLRAN